MKSQQSSLHKNIVPIFTIILLSFIFFSPVIFQSKTLYAFDTLFDYLPWTSEAHQKRAHNTLITDSVNVFYNYYNYTKQCLALKSLPFWNPNNFSGLKTSPTGHPIAFFFYLIFPQLLAHDLILWLHLTCAGVFMFFYLKEIELNKYAAILGAVAWMFNGYVMVWFEFENVIIMAPTLPASLLFIERWLTNRKDIHALLLVCAISLSITNGSAQLNIYQLIFIAIYTAYKSLILKKKNSFPPIRRQNIMTIFICILLITSISALFLFRHLTYLEDPQRREFSFGELYNKTGQLPTKYLTTLVFPDFYGTPAGDRNTFTPHDKGAHPYNNYSELCIYSGIIPLFLFFACIPYLGKKECASLYFFTILLTFSMAAGSYLYYPFATFIPGLNLSTPSRILYIFGFAVSALAAIGSNLLIKAEVKEKKAILKIWSLLLVATVGIVFYVQTEVGIKWAAESVDWQNPERVLRIMKKHFSLFSPVIFKPLFIVISSVFSMSLMLVVEKKKQKNIFFIISIIILSYDLISFGRFYNTASPKRFEFPETVAIRFLKKDASVYRIATHGNFMHNSFAPYGIQDIGGYHSFYPKRYGEFLHLSQNGLSESFPDMFSRWTSFSNFTSPLLNIINTKYLLVSPEVSLVSIKTKLVYNDEIKIYKNREAFQRAFFVPSYHLCNSRLEAYETLAGFTNQDFRQKVILESDPLEYYKQNENSKGHNKSVVNILSYKPDEVIIEITADKQGFLVLSDNFHPEWEATVDGEKAEVLRANYIMRAVPIKRGYHEVVFKFRPKLLIAGSMITLLGWIFLGFFITMALRRNSGNN